MKRRIVTLSAVGLLTWLTIWVLRTSSITAAAEGTLLIGFALLAAGLLGEIVEFFRLPRITGYIVAGVVFGPHVGGLLSTEALNDLTIFNDMAFAFIGLAAGAELRLTTLRGRLRSIALLILLTTPVVMLCVGSGFYFLASIGGFLGSMTPLQVVAVASLVGVIGAARSPSSAIAIIDETKAEGPFTETILGVSVAMDVVVICVFSATAALCGLAFAPEKGLDLWFVITLMGQILGSIAIGCGLGAGIGTYLKHRGPQLPLVIVGLCFFVYRFSEILGHHLEETYGITLHLEPLLICAAAGFVIQNLSHQGERLIHTMEQVSLPVYVIFFTMAGARLDLSALTASWSIAILIAGTRVAALVVGTRLATSLAGDPPDFRNNAWLGFVTQAGLSLALIAQIESSFGDWGARLATILVAVVAINQLFGPAAFKIALERVGETRRGVRLGRRTA